MRYHHARLLIVASLLPFSTLWLPAEDSATSQEPTVSQVVQTETANRQQLLASAKQSMADGWRLLSTGKYDEAADRFQYALDAITNGGISESLYNIAESGLAAAKAGQARELAKETMFAKAATRLEEAISLQPNDPTYTRDLEDLKRQQMAYEAQVRDPEGTVNNPAVTEDFKDRVATVQKLLFQGDAYFKTGQYAMAEETYSKALILDPYSKAARDKMEHIEKYRYRADAVRHEQYEQEGYTDLDLKWSEQISPDIVVPPTAALKPENPSNRAAITRKLQSIIIDKVNFDKLDIATVIDFLQEKSKELDPDHEGINFVLRLTSDTAPPAPPAGTENAAPAAPGATPAPTDNTGAPGATPSDEGTEQKQIHRTVSITLENIPLIEVLRYITDQTNLQYSVEDYAVYLRPSIDEGETLTVRTFIVPPGLFTGAALHVSAPTGTDRTDQGATVGTVSTDVKTELESRGIRFPPGATATFLSGSSKLVVRDTPEQLDLIADRIGQLSQEPPQIEISAKLAEFNQDAIKGLSFNYGIGAGNPFFGISTALRDPNYVGSSVDSNGGLQGDGIDQLIEANVQQDNSSSGGSYSFPLSVPGEGSPTTVAPNTPNVLTVGGTINSTVLSAVMQAINNMTGVSVLASPTITTQNGIDANIDIVREFPYPTSFEKPKLSTSPVAYSSGPGSGTNYPLLLAVPPSPREFATTDIGVSLEVKPTTYPDRRIDLDITKAQVLDFDGFINYGADIVELLSAVNLNNPKLPATPAILTTGVINQPVFNVRNVVTRLQVLDGQTAVLGGLIREDTQEINDKVPVLGDLPLIGRLFQSKVTERTKKNLIIFITARLIKSTGKPEYIKTLNAEPEEEKLPEPEPIGPGVTLPPLPAGAEGGPNS